MRSDHCIVKPPPIRDSRQGDRTAGKSTALSSSSLKESLSASPCPQPPSPLTDRLPPRHECCLNIAIGPAPPILGSRRVPVPRIFGGGHEKPVIRPVRAPGRRGADARRRSRLGGVGGVRGPTR